MNDKCNYFIKTIMIFASITTDPKPHLLNSGAGVQPAWTGDPGSMSHSCSLFRAVQQLLKESYCYLGEDNKARLR